jgi:heme-degrading monooxygenase HmoA
MVDVFVLPEELEDEFFKNWKQTADFYSQIPGFLDTNLYRNTGVGDGAFKFINVAHFEDAAAFNSAHANYTSEQISLPGVKHHPAIFESVMHITPADI